MTSRRVARLWFVGLMSAAAFPVAWYTANGFLNGQADRFSDLMKISALVSVATGIISYILWTIVQAKPSNVIRGGLIGATTAVLVVQIPLAAYALKTGLNLELGLVAMLRNTVAAGLSIFTLKTKLSLAAMLGSTVVGAGVAYASRNAGHD